MFSKSDSKKVFSQLTGASSEIASKYLAQYHGDTNAAINAYLESHQGPRQTSQQKYPKKLVDIYDKYKDPEDESIISIDGTLAYLEDLKIDPEDIRSLLLAFMLNSPQTGVFKKSNFLNSWSIARCHSLQMMRTGIDISYEKIMATPESFEPFYQYCFEFIRGSDSHSKSISYEDAGSYWTLLFGELKDVSSAADRLAQWYEFVNDAKKPISKDLWNMFYKFLTEIICTDPASFSDYDEMSSWPSMVDEYVEWLSDNGTLTRSDE